VEGNNFGTNERTWASSPAAFELGYQTTDEDDNRGHVHSFLYLMAGKTLGLG